MSNVMRHMSFFTCHVSHTMSMCQVMHKKMKKKKLQPGGACRWRVCYQRCIPRLVFVDSKSCRASKLLYWFKSSGNFDELMQGLLRTLALRKLKPDCGESPDFFQTESDIREIIFLSKPCIFPTSNCLTEHIC